MREKALRGINQKKTRVNKICFTSDLINFCLPIGMFFPKKPYMDGASIHIWLDAS